jgi:hypothetical protein
MMIDAFEVEGITEIAVDSIFMMPHLGVLSTVHAAAATEVFEKDCLIRLGTCIAPVGRKGRDAHLASVEIGGAKKIDLKVGELQLIAVEHEGKVPIVVTPNKNVDVGAGPGVTVRKEVHGGVCGIVLDGRGRRPLPMPATESARVAAATQWNETLDLYPAAAV